jgi:hypothetical protein
VAAVDRKEKEIGNPHKVTMLSVIKKFVQDFSCFAPEQFK